MFPFPVVPAQPPLIPTYLDYAASTANSASYTFAGVAIGDGDYVVVSALAWGAAVTDIKVGGVSVDKLVTSADYGGPGGFSFGIIKHPGGSTADITVVCSGSASRAQCVTYELNGVLLDTDPHDALYDTSSPYSGTIDVPAGGFVLGIGGHSTTALQTFTGLTNDRQAAIEGTASATFGSDATNVPEAGKAITFSGNSNMFCISWR